MTCTENNPTLELRIQAACKLLRGAPQGGINMYSEYNSDVLKIQALEASREEVERFSAATPTCLPDPGISLLGGNRVYAHALGGDGSIVIVLKSMGGDCLAYGVLDAARAARLRKQLAPLPAYDYKYPAALAGARDTVPQVWFGHYCDMRGGWPEPRVLMPGEQLRRA